MLTENIVYFLHGISSIYKELNNGWVQILCPFCDDATRKSSKISHGHFYIAKTFNYCHCFRCDYQNSLSRALTSLGFNDKTSLLVLTQNNTNNFYYFKNKLTPADKINGIFNFLEEYYLKFKNNNPIEFDIFLKYIYSRCGDINSIDFLMQPIIKDGYLLISFYNINGQLVTSRFITKHPKLRYLNEHNAVKPYYFFQDIYNISDYSNIVICEGAFDLINLYRYYKHFDNAFYIAIGGKQFSKILKELLTSYLLIGNYHFNIILDNDLNIKLTKLTNSCNNIIQALNPFATINFFIPSLYKDVTDLVQLEKIK